MQITLNVNKEYSTDVLVVGGGVSGVSTAISAARQGASVILVEEGGCLGGTATKGLVGPFMTSYDHAGKKQIIKGLFVEIVERLKAKNAGVDPSDCPGATAYSAYRQHGHIGVSPFKQQILKIVLEEMCVEAGVKIFYHTQIVSTDTADGKIQALYGVGCESVIKFNVKAVADCSGKATVAYMSGAETYFGDETGFVQPSSLFFTLQGIDKKAHDKHCKKYFNDERSRVHMSQIEKAREQGKFSSGTIKTRLFLNPDNKTWTVNMAQYNDDYDQFSAEEVSRIEIEQRQQALEIVEFLKTLPLYKNAELVEIAENIGVRQSRQMKAIRQFTLQDIESGQKFEDHIAYCSNSVDVHQKVGVSYVPNKKNNYYIPLSCMISKDLSNLVGVGKCIDADMFAFGAVRVMPPCIAMGQAAGITLALAIKENLPAKAVDVKQVQNLLLENGACLGE